MCWPHRAGFDDAQYYSASYQQILKEACLYLEITLFV